MNISFFDGPKKTQIRSITTNKAQGTTTLKSSASLAGLTKDTFTPGGDTKAAVLAAKKFHKAANNLFIEFKTEIPSDHHGVNDTLRKVLTPVEELFQHMCADRKDHHFFIQMIGEDNIKPLVECNSNSVVASFKESFKKSFNADLHDVVKQIFK